jgi:sugar transferase (PEP-CTERM/EpsH1 system associated)
MSGILFLAHRLPFPPDRGDKIRSYHVLKALAEMAPVHVGCLADDERELSFESELASVAESYCMPRRRKLVPVAALEALARRKPVSLVAFDHRTLHGWVRRTLAEERIQTIYVFSGQMGQYVPRDWQGRVVVDLVDVDSAKFEAYAAQHSGLLGWMHAREARLLRREEARLAGIAEHTLLVSEAEASLMKARLPAHSGAAVAVLGNGIDADQFDPAHSARHPALVGPGPHLVFTGQLDYPPNVTAALRAIDRVMPLIRLAQPTARFHVVGRAPVPELQAREGVNGARIWGEVPDVRPFLAAADLVLVPLLLARGVQNKVLEAMAMARPVLMTGEAATGLPGAGGVHYSVADSDEALAQHAIDLLDNRDRSEAMGDAARQLVLETRSWPAMLARLPDLVGLPRPELLQPVQSRSVRGCRAG